VIDERELYVLSFYRASELAGALLFGRVAFHTDVAELRAPLTEHCAEEAGHAWQFTQLIARLGRTPIKVKATFQTEIARSYGMPTSLIEILALTQIFEERVLQHYQAHAAMSGVHPQVAETLHAMIADEYGHIDWVDAELRRCREAYGDEGVEAAMARARSADRQAYEYFVTDDIYKTYFKELP
jgi:rubrerythrin